jgi:L-glutamine---4-(methylsulfanyl)-2-oxobutanoate aminotransferase
MRVPLADRMSGLPKQFFANLVAQVNARVQAGHDVINLGQGNPDLPTPAHIVEALRQASLDPNTHKYPPFRGLPRLKQAVAHFYQREYQVDLDPETEVAVLFGGKTGLVELSEIYLNPGDVALVPDPGYPDYWSGISLAGGRMVTFPLLAEHDFLPDLESISKDAWDLAKLMFINYPNNPTGAVANPQFYEQLVARCAEHAVLMVHDFAYGAIGFDGVKPPSFLQTPGAKEVGIEIYTLSKTYNMAGWRVAFAVGNRDVVAAMNLLQDHYYVSLFGAVQLAAVEALEGDQSCVQELTATYERRRNTFVLELERQGYSCPVSSGSFFEWIPVPHPHTSSSFAQFLLETANVAVAPGIGFGHYGDGYVRIGLLTSEERLQEAARRIAVACRGESQ